MSLGSPNPKLNGTPDFEGYMQHGLQIRPDERELAQQLCSELPSTIVDVHTHASPDSYFNFEKLTEAGRASMVSTYPVTTIEDSHLIDKMLWPGLTVRKVRFSHATNGHDQFGVNRYLTEQCPDGDVIAFFGLSDTPEQVDETIAGLDSGAFNGLKMYYAALREHTHGPIYSYFPKPVLAAAEKVGVPIILHLPNSLVHSVSDVEDVCEEFPGLQIMLAHAGVSFAYSPKIEKALATLASKGQITVDTSGVTDTKVLEACVRQLGYQRVLFGSDEPFNLMRDVTYVHPELGPRLLTDMEYHWVIPEERERFLYLRDPQAPNNHIQQLTALVRTVLQLPDAARDAIFAGNAQRIFGFED